MTGVFIDLTAKTFSRLTVLKLKSRGPVVWLCQCECGRKTEVITSYLVSGHTKSCGCLRSAPSGRNLNISGERFGDLVAIRAVGKCETGYVWECRCDCGSVATATVAKLNSGKKLSCGCRRSRVTTERNHKHGKSGTKTFRSWASMRQRCTNPSDGAFDRYGGRGIAVSPRWGTFANFLEDMGECPPGATLDRIDNEKGYEPNNCRWATRAQQNRNTRGNRWLTFDGRRMVLSDWAKERGINKTTLRMRLERGWPVEKSLNLPLQKSKTYHK